MARVERVYSSVFGGESGKGQLYGGFYTFLGGIFLGLAALVLFFFSQNKPEGSLVFFQWREAAFIMAALALLAIFWGISLALPSKRGMRIISFVGVAVGLVATVLLSVYYPYHLNVGAAQGDQSALVAGLFAVSLGAIIVATFTGVIGYYIGRMTGGGRGTGDGVDWSSPDAYDIPDSVIEKDIEFAMRRYKYSWGEGESTQAAGVQINVRDEFEAGTVVGGGKGVARTVQLDSPQVDDATAALRSVRPTKDKELSGEWADETTNALLAFRKQKQELVQAKARMTWWQRLLAFLGVKRYRAIGTEGAPPAGGR